LERVRVAADIARLALQHFEDEATGGSVDQRSAARVLHEASPRSAMNQPDRLPEITARLDAAHSTPKARDHFLAHAPDDVQWLIRELTQARADAAALATANTEMNDLLDELRYRINDAGSLMDTGYVADAIGHTRVPGHDPRTHREH
jgi:hypothetical protein